MNTRYTAQELIQRPGSDARAYTVKRTDDIKAAVRACRVADTVARKSADRGRFRTFRVIDWNTGRVVYIANPDGRREWIGQPAPTSAVLAILRPETPAMFRMMRDVMQSGRVAPLPA